jgi:hypothetical protein
MNKKIISIIFTCVMMMFAGCSDDDGSSSGESRLKANFPLNGSVADTMSYFTNGTTYNMTQAQNRDMENNKAYFFNGTTSRITYNSGDITAGNEVSVTCWIKPADLATASLEVIIDCNDFSLVQYNGEIRFLISIPGFNYALTEIPTAGSWYFIAGTYDGKFISIYHNGILTDRQYHAGNISDHGKHLVFGTNYSTSVPADLYWNGTLDDVRFYDRALTEDEIYSMSFVKD